MTKVDFKKELAFLYNPSKKDFSIVDVPSMAFLMIDGQGDPNTSRDYQDALQALYGMAYTLKFKSKGELEKDYTVPPLEGLWWADDLSVFTASGKKDQWLWTMMIMTPDWISQEMINAAKTELQEKKNPRALGNIRFKIYHEGLAVQIMHLGPYAEEGPTIARMHSEFIPQNGLVENGKHHEVYISDPRRTAPEKIKTVLRHPVRKV